MQFTHNKTGEAVEVETWVWAVVYKDGTELHQFDPNTNLFHSITEIDKNKAIESFVMYRAFDNPNYDRRIDICVRDGQSVFHKYRNVILNAGTLEELRAKVYVFGCGDKDHQIINYILPNDKVIQSTQDIDDILKYL